MSLTRAGALPPAGTQVVNLTSDLTRQVGRIVVVSAANIEKLTAALPGSVELIVAGAAIDPRAIRALLATDLVNIAEQRASLLHVTNTGAVNAAVTATLPAVAGQFHYITSIQLVKLYNVIGVAAGAGVIVTSTNLPGNPAWTTEQLASPAGTAPLVIDYQPATPLRSAVVNTNTTLVAPVQLQTIWRWNVSYFTAP